MNSQREAILDYLVDALGGVTGVKVGRSRTAPKMANEGIVVNLMPQDEQRTLDFLGTDEHRALGVDVGISGRGRIPDKVVDPYVVAVHAALMANLTLGGLAVGIDFAGREWDIEGADEDVVHVTTRYTITYQIPRDDESYTP